MVAVHMREEEKWTCVEDAWERQAVENAGGTEWVLDRGGATQCDEAVRRGEDGVGQSRWRGR